ncbi:MAG: Gfo/Idh/MocA family oxidoreductase [Acidobacteriaceae bacterium]
MDRAVRWGVWGTGAVANHVVSDFGLADGAVVQAVASRRGERAQDFASRHGVARWYEGLGPLLDDAEVEAVYIASPNHRHFDDCLAAIGAGKGVLCEKPFALNLRQAQEIANTARQRQVFCMEGMWTRFIPAVVEAKRWIDSGAIGAVRLVQGNFAYPAAASPESRLFDRECGGGALLDRGVYLISLTQQILGAPETIRGSAWMGVTGVDEQSVYQLGYANGALADLAASLHVRGTNEVVIYGENGRLRLCDPFYRAHRLRLQSYSRPQADGAEQNQAKADGLRSLAGAVRDSPGLKSLRRRLDPVLSLLQRGRARSFPFAGNGYQFELLEASRCIREKRTESEVMPLEDSLGVMRTMDALRAEWGLVYPQDTSDQPGSLA